MKCELFNLKTLRYYYLLFLGLCALLPSRASGQSILVGWEESQAPDIAGYKVYVGPSSRQYEHCFVTGLENGFLVDNPPEYKNLYFAVTAFDSSWNESTFSAEILFRSDKNLTPFSLNASYPNPFNPVTRIRFVLTTRLGVKLSVYDILGRRVRQIVDEEMDPGEHEVSWDGTDENGRTVANGVYFCRMQVGQFCVSRKLILAR